MAEKYVRANGINLAYDEFGREGDPVILLIMGLGTQMTAWPEEFCIGLADQGFRVIRFDNRDIGLSEKMRHAPVPNLLKLAVLDRLKLPLSAPYSLRDMAQDTLGLLDALGIEHAHFVGASMGGMIAQIIAAEQPDRVSTLTSIMSTSGRRELPGADAEVTMLLIKRPKTIDAQQLINHSKRIYRAIGSPGYPPTEEELDKKLTASFKRSYYPAGYKRQLAAIAVSGDRVDVLQNINVPTLVIHGKADRLIPVEGGIDTAKIVPGARLELIDGMGHDLPRPLVPRFIELISTHAVA